MESTVTMIVPAFPRRKSSRSSFFYEHLLFIYSSFQLLLVSVSFHGPARRKSSVRLSPASFCFPLRLLRPPGRPAAGGIP